MRDYAEERDILCIIFLNVNCIAPSPNYCTCNAPAIFILVGHCLNLIVLHISTKCLRFSVPAFLFTYKLPRCNKENVYSPWEF